VPNNFFVSAEEHDEDDDVEVQDDVEQPEGERIAAGDVEGVRRVAGMAAEVLELVGKLVVVRLVFCPNVTL
jgi:hypothetical protein